MVCYDDAAWPVDAAGVTARAAVAGVEGRAAHVLTQAADGLLQLAVVAPGRNHARAGCRHPANGLEPHARRPADHHHCLLFQSHVDSFE